MTTPTTPPADTPPATALDSIAPESTATETAPVSAPVSAPETAPDCAQQLAQMFPALFGGPPKPIKLRIQNDIQERAPGVFSKQALSGFFRRYTTTTSYLIAVSRARHRFDLDGQPAGELSDEHRQVAVTELARRRAIRDSRRELEEAQRRNRATLLRDFESTTLTPANFCALKGVAVEELDGLIALARQEAEERRLSARPGGPSPATPHRRGPAERRPRPAGRRQNGSG